MRVLTLLILLAGCSGTGSGVAAPETRSAFRRVDTARAPAGALPDHVRPTGYRLRIGVDPVASEVFDGLVEIDVSLDTATDLIWIHGQDLVVERVVATFDGEVIPAEWREVLPDEGVAAVVLGRPVGPGSGTLRIRYTGLLGHATPTPRRRGFFRASFRGETFAATQFEMMDARRAFPCFDDPRFRAPFEFELVIPDSMMAASNSPVQSESRAGFRRTRLRFDPTPPLPTYLLGWVVGPFGVVELPPLPPTAMRPRPLPLRGLTPRSERGRMDWLLAQAGRIVSETERQLGVPYPHPKLDLVFVPDHPYLGMENAALITLNVGDDASPPLGPDMGLADFSAEVVAHEVAHQWFGNLVGIQWWDEVWLMESLARWVAAHVVGAVYGARTNYPADFAGVSRRDGLTRAHAVLRPLPTATDVRNHSGHLRGFAEEKLLLILNSVEGWIGEAALWTGLRHLAERHRFGIASTDDLIEAIDRASSLEVRPMLERALTQPGIPLVSFRRVCEPNRRGVELSQRRYFASPHSAPSQRWHLPICVRYPRDGSTQETCEVLRGTTTGFLAFEGDACPEWYVPNAEGAGYYVATLDVRDQAAHLAHFDSMSEAEQRWSLTSLWSGIDDGRVQIASLVPSLTHLIQADSRHVLLSVLHLVSLIRNYLVTDTERTSTDAWVRELLRPLYDLWAWGEGDPRLARTVGTNLLALLALDVRDPNVRRDARQRALEFIARERGTAQGDGGVGIADATRIALAVAFQDEPGLISRTEDLLDPSHRTRSVRLLFAAGLAGSPRSAAALQQLGRLDRDALSLALRRLLTTAETREETWLWVVPNAPMVRRRAARPFSLPVGFNGLEAIAPLCDAERATMLLASADTEEAEWAHRTMERCGARVRDHADGVRALFAPEPGGPRR